MKVSDIITTERQLFLGGKHNYKSTLTGAGDNISGIGKSNHEAEAALLKALQDAEKHAGKRRYFWSSYGRTVFVLYWYGGWCYDITEATRDHPSTTMFEAGCKEEKAIEDVKRHAAYYES